MEDEEVPGLRGASPWSPNNTADPWLNLAAAIIERAVRALHGRQRLERRHAAEFFLERDGIFEAACDVIGVDRRKALRAVAAARVGVREEAKRRKKRKRTSEKQGRPAAKSGAGEIGRGTAGPR